MTSKPILLFPGQGSQYVGMGADLCDKYPAARDVFVRVEELSGLPIRRLAFEGPEEELRETRHTQPVILTHSLAVLAILPRVTPACVAGHSLGEYSALYAAGVLDFESVVRLVKRRAELMWEEGDRNPGTMAAVIGLPAGDVEALCEEVDGVVVAANYNEPKQTVVSGEVPAVRRVVELAPERGALKAVMLPVSGAFHSPLLEESAAGFADFLRQFDVGTPSCPVIPNVTGAPTTDPAEIRRALTQQLTSPVRWVDTVVRAAESGGDSCFEVGPGRVLKGLARRINRDFAVTSLGTADQVGACLAG